MNIIKEQMVKMNITQDNLVECTGLSQPSISLLINGKLKSLKVDTALKLSKILEVSLDDIFMSLANSYEAPEESEDLK